MSVPEGSVVLLRALVGSTIHGTAVEGTDDRDEMAIAVEPRRYVLGLQHWETSVERTAAEGEKSGPGDLDLVTHSLRKFCRLAAKGNPSILLPLFVPREGIVSTTDLGKELVACRAMFLSRAIGGAFLGYMQAQKARLEGRQGGKHGGARPDLVAKYGFDTKYAGHIIRLGYQGCEMMAEGHLSLPMRKAEADEVIAVRRGERTLDEVLTLGGILERRLKDLLGESPLPAEPDHRTIDDFLDHAYCRVWGILWHGHEYRSMPG